MTEPLDQVSNWLSISQAAEALKLPPGKVKRLIEEHHLIAVKRSGELSIPAEIIIDGEPLHSLKGTISVLLDSGFSLDSAINWLYTVEPSLRGTPMQSLLAGRKSEVRRLAQSLAL
ncbi:MAG: DNA-binding protein [Actinobacteria bacterium]|nr:DNA-binding protein [Actinomycetota bacterium]